MRTTAFLLALSLAPARALSLAHAGASADRPAAVTREESVAAARSAVDAAPERARSLSATPLEYALVWLTIPYAGEPVALDPQPSWFEVAALLRRKQAYWSARLEAAAAPLSEPAGLPDAFDSARAALRAEAAASAIRLIVADIEADRAVLRAPRSKFSPQDLLDRKSALFKRLSATRIP